MLLIRRCEERLVKSFYEGLIPGRYFSSLGQEAVAVGVCHHLQDTDVVFSTHRGQGHALAKGMAPVSLMAELYGRSAGCASGRAGSSFLYDASHGLLGTSGIAGASILQAIGAAHAFQMNGEEKVAVAFFGDGAAGAGAFHEGLILAGAWQLPVLLVCENNQDGGRSGAEAMRKPRAALRSKSYDVHGVELNGNDVAEVYAAAFEGIRRAREGKGPMLLECHTTRHRPPAEGDVPGTQLSSDELSEVRGKDPLPQLGERLVANYGVREEELAEMDVEVTREVEEAHRRAINSPWPEPVTIDSPGG
jgi:2-oxoisovalerate dehydrogenase E1 component